MISGPVFRKTVSCLLGFLVTLLLLEAGLRLGESIGQWAKERENAQTLRRTGAYRILCLGESTTDRQYPQALERILNARSRQIRFSVIDKGVTATNTFGILRNVGTYLSEYRPNMVVAMMGINDLGVKYYETIPERNSWLFQHCRLYRWVRILEAVIAKGSMPVGPTDAETALNKVLTREPHSDKAWRELGHLYQTQNYFSKAEVCFKKAVESDPANALNDYVLGHFYRITGAFDQAEHFLKKAIAISPEDPRAYFDLGGTCHDRGDFSAAERYFKKVIELAPRNTEAYLRLGWLARRRKDPGAAEAYFKKSAEINPYSEYVLSALISLYEETGRTALAQPYRALSVRMGFQGYSDATRANYRALKKILDRNGVRLVCSQYPMRRMEPLRKIFQGEQGVLFIDNSEVFRRAIRKDGYAAYFRDMFAGDFGHCTPRGNELLAQNIAEVILREIHVPKAS